MIRVAWRSTCESTGKPRASGDDPVVCPLTPDESRVNPARAGMIRRTRKVVAVAVGKPRASGDDPVNSEISATFQA